MTKGDAPSSKANFDQVSVKPSLIKNRSPLSHGAPLPSCLLYCLTSLTLPSAVYTCYSTLSQSFNSITEYHIPTLDQSLYHYPNQTIKMHFAVFILPAIVAAQSMTGMTMSSSVARTNATGAIATKAANATSAINSAVKSAVSNLSTSSLGTSAAASSVPKTTSASGSGSKGGAAQTAVPFLGAIAGAGLAFAGLL